MCRSLIVHRDLIVVAISSRIIELKRVLSSDKIDIQNRCSLRKNFSVFRICFVFVKHEAGVRCVGIARQSDKDRLAMDRDRGVALHSIDITGHALSGGCPFDFNRFDEIVSAGTIFFPDQDCKAGLSILNPLCPYVCRSSDRYSRIKCCRAFGRSVPTVKCISRTGRSSRHFSLSRGTVRSYEERRCIGYTGAVLIEHEPMSVGYLCKQCQGVVGDGKTGRRHIDLIAVLINIANFLFFRVYHSPSAEVGSLGLVLFVTAGDVVRSIGEFYCVGDALISVFIKDFVRIDGYAKLIPIGDVIGFEDHRVKIDLISIRNGSRIQERCDFVAHFIDIKSCLRIIYGEIFFLCPSLEDITCLHGADTGIVDVGVHLTRVQLVLRKAHGSNEGRAVRSIEIDEETGVGVNAFHNDVDGESIRLKLLCRGISDLCLHFRGASRCIINVIHGDVTSFNTGIGEPYRYGNLRLDLFAIPVNNGHIDSDHVPDSFA